MTRFLLAIAAVFLLTGVFFAQSAQSGPGPGNCDQVRQAVATYGYAAAKRYALAHYGPQAVAYGERCLAGGHYKTKHYVHYYKPKHYYHY
jgi:hypothetical protein